MNLGAPEIILIVLAVLLLFGYKKLPDASRSIGRSLRIFTSTTSVSSARRRVRMLPDRGFGTELPDV